LSLTIQDYITAVQSINRKHVCKIEVLDQYQNVLEIIQEDIISGNVNINNSLGARRSATLTLKNDDGKYSPSYRGTLWIQKRIRIFSGLNINGEDYFIDKGIFVISEVQAISNFSEKLAIITLLDKFSFLDGTIAGDLTSEYIIPVGTNVRDAVIAIFQQAGEVIFPVIYTTSETTPYTIIKNSGDTYSSLLTDLANMVSYTCYYSKFGIPMFVQPTNEQLEHETYNFSTTEVNYLGSTHRFKFDSVKNTVFVYGDNIEGHLVKASSIDTNWFSSTRVSLIGTRSLIITDENIYTDQLAQDRADYELKKAIILQESVDLQSIPIDLINEGDVITILDSSNLLNRDRYLVNSISTPLLSNGNATLNCWKIRAIT